MLTVACVEVSNYCGRGQEYVSKLRSMVRRHLSLPHRFLCLTDDTTRHPELGRGEYQELPNRAKDGLVGWWAKVFCFSPDRFEGRVVFLDLDSVVVESLDRLVESKGIIHLKDWGWTKNDYGSGVMVWDSGEHSEIWSRYTPDVPHQFRGDQDFIRAVSEWPALPDGMTRSYRYHCKEGPPKGCAVVAFHGVPKPHSFPAGSWVAQAWQ